MKKYILPFLIIIGGSFLLNIIRKSVSIPSVDVLITVLSVILAFVLGASLNDRRSTRGDSWLRKMIIMFLFIAFVLFYLGVIKAGFLNEAFKYLGFTDIIYYFLFIWFGYLFFC